MVAAIAANVQIGLQLAVEQHLLAARAFVPEIVRHVFLPTAARIFGSTKLVSQLIAGF